MCKMYSVYLLDAHELSGTLLNRVANLSLATACVAIVVVTVSVPTMQNALSCRCVQSQI